MRCLLCHRSHALRSIVSRSSTAMPSAYSSTTGNSRWAVGARRGGTSDGWIVGPTFAGSLLPNRNQRPQKDRGTRRNMRA